MSRLICGFLPLVSLSTAYAQSAEPPVEHASAATVAIFLILFIGGCVGYIWYAWWSGRKEKLREHDVRVEPISRESR